MSILITGHKGFIGSNFFNYVKENTDWEVDGWEYTENDFPKVYKYDWVIHLGAISSTRERDVDLIMKMNYHFSVKLWEACWGTTNLQYASSASVYGDNWAFHENSQPNPQSPYAWSKYLFDGWTHLHEFNGICQGFRYFNVYGDGEENKGDDASPVTKFTQQAKERPAISLFNNSDEYCRDFVWVGDVIRAQIEFIKNVDESGIWNIGTGQSISFADIANTIAEKHKSKIRIINMPDDMHCQYQPYTCAEMQKFDETLPNFEWTQVLDWIKSREL